jgi:signal transduction histidine kinase
MEDFRQRQDGTNSGPHQAALSEIAHLFRTPLGVITGYVELLRTRDDPGLRADALDEIAGAAARLVGAVDLLVSVLEAESEGLSELFVERSKTSQT